jgi:hypothetical protein
MTAPKRFRRSMVTHEKDFVASTSTFIGPILTPTASISPTIETHSKISNLKETSPPNQLINLQNQTLHFEQKDRFDQKKSQLVQNHFEIVSKLTTKNQQKMINVTKTIVDEIPTNGEDDWVLFKLNNNNHFFAIYSSGVSSSCGIKKSRL